MSFWIGVGILVLGLLVSIGLHELGHLLPAKRFGVYVPQYFIGFGPTLWSTRRGETEYGLKLLPLGGYVRLVGMFPPREETRTRARAKGSWFSRVTEDARAYSQSEVPEGEQHRAFYRLSTPKKLAVMFGGPVTNLILAVVLFAIVLSGFGIAMPTNKLGTISQCVSSGVEECTAADPAAPSVIAGFQEEDRVLAWGGMPVHTWDELSESIQAGGVAPTEVLVERGGQELTLTVTPVLTERPLVEGGQVVLDSGGAPVLTEVPYVGVGPAVETVRLPLSAVPGEVNEVLVGTAGIVASLPSRLVSIANSVFTDSQRDPNIIGIVGVGRFAGEIASIPAEQLGLKQRAAGMLSLLASLNIALFVFNMIPLLPLDGGHIAGALYEGARRRISALKGERRRLFADTARLMPLTYVVFTMLLGMSVLLVIADIVKPVTLG